MLLDFGMTKSPSDLVLLYDGLCGFCDRMVQFILKHDPGGAMRFAPLQGAYQSVNALPGAPGFPNGGTAFQQSLAFYESAAGGSLSPTDATTAAIGQVVQGTHSAEAPFCTEAAFQFFLTVLNAGG